MRRSSLLAAADVVVLILSGVAAAALPSGGVMRLDALWFLVGLSVLTFADVWLPRGDAIGMSAALVLGAVLLFDARVVIGLLLLSEALALIPRGRKDMWQAALQGLAAQAVAAIATSAVLVLVSLHPSGGLLWQRGTSLSALQYAYLLGAGLLFALLEFGLVQFEAAITSRQPVRSTMLGGFSFGIWLIAAHTSAGILAAIMYRTMSVWGLVVAVIMILVMRQSFVLLLDIRQAYNATIGVLIRVMDVQSPGHEGSSEQNALVSTAVGRALGLHGRDLERLRYAALLLDVGQEEGEQSHPADSAERILGDVEFLDDVVPILDLCNGCRVQASRSDLTCAYIILAVGEATGSVQSHRTLTLRERVSPRIAADIERAVRTEIALHGPAPRAKGVVSAWPSP